MTCEKMGNCTLQDLAYELKVSPSGMNGERYNHPVDVSNPS
jgi:NADH dehydrogenase/NADH:ubiquinone oxidoreductase subunit G